MKFHAPAFVLSLSLLPSVVFCQHFRVAVIGGGMAGVSAAHHIHEFDPDASITIFEKEKALGGNAKTVSIPNANHQTVKVDAGPQYFTEGPWDEYIKFLKTYNEYNTAEMSEFVGSISIQTDGGASSRLITPLNGSFRGERLGQLLHFKKLCDIAFKVYKNRDGKHALCIGDWVKELELDQEFKEEVTLPFLAASLGTSVENIKRTSTVEIVKLFAFRKPSDKNTFKVMHEGMGTLIQHIGNALQAKGIRVLTESPVQGLEYNSDTYTVNYLNGTEPKQETFDFVVLAVHANQAYKLLKNDTAFNAISIILNKFEYFQARIVLHGDSTLVNNAKPAFLNVITTDDNQIVANTMNLGMISDRYKGIYKSWLTEELCAKVKAGGHFYHEEIFYHPLITPGFSTALKHLAQAVDQKKGLNLSGGWTQGLETQETAVVSGKKAMEKYRLFRERRLP